VNVHEILAGVVYRGQNVTVMAFAVHHGKWAHAYGYRFATPHRTIVIAGDTSPDATITDCGENPAWLFPSRHAHASDLGYSHSVRWRVFPIGQTRRDLVRCNSATGGRIFHHMYDEVAFPCRKSATRAWGFPASR
jgi:hypothetical protein